ncbi:MAG: type I phosphomannose isomerase catalytic subunit [Candidatus Acidiferrum sp.]
MRPEPIRIEPIFSPRIWGSRFLAPLFPQKANLQEPLGEAWLTGVDCKIATGPFAEKTLAEAWREMPSEWRGSDLWSTNEFPLLVKFIFPKDKLSIQVHPDDAYAALHEKAAGGRGKTEMWHIVSAEPGAQLLAGLKPGVTKEKFRQGLAAHTLEDLFQSHPVHTGDTFFIPARTPHTIGANMVVFEVQEYSDLTYRVYDYDRVDAQGKPRELHIEKALDVMNFSAEPVCPLRTGIPMGHSGPACIHYLAACRYFAVEKWKFESGSANGSLDPKRFEIVVVLKGSGHIRWDGGESHCEAGQCWFLPATLGKYTLGSFPEASETLRVYVPDIVGFEKRAADKGFEEKVRRQFIFL